MSRKFVFTINNYTEAEVKRIKDIPCARIVAGKEVGDEGTPHVQGAVVFTRPMRITAVRNALGGRAHVEEMMGTWSNQDYCVKDGEVIRIADNTKQGSREDLVKFREAIKDGQSWLELCENHIPQMCKYHKFAVKYRELLIKESTKEFREIEVHVRWGGSGHGEDSRTDGGGGIYVLRRPARVVGWVRGRRDFTPR